MAGAHVAGSPFRLLVAPGAPSANASLAYGSGIVSSLAGGVFGTSAFTIRQVRCLVFYVFSQLEWSFAFRRPRWVGLYRYGGGKENPFSRGHHRSYVVRVSGPGANSWRLQRSCLVSLVPNSIDRIDLCRTTCWNHSGCCCPRHDATRRHRSVPTIAYTRGMGEAGHKITELARK